MMLLSSAILLLTFAAVMADLENELGQCTENIDFDNLEKALTVPGEDELTVLCPVIIGLFDCIEGAVEEETGFSAEQLAVFMAGTDAQPYLDVYLNTKSVFEELCDEDSQLHKDYRANAGCYEEINSLNDVDGSLCESQAEAAFKTYKEFEDIVQEEVGVNSPENNRQCMLSAYMVACVAADIHETCGQHAFDTYMQLIKRTTVFKNVICSDDKLNIVKTDFLDSLKMDSSQKEIYRLAFDLRKRKK